MATGGDFDDFGADDIGFDMSSLGPLFQSAGGMASGAISDYELEEKKKAATAAEKRAADAAVAADVTAALAMAKALTSAKLKQSSAAMDKKAADQAVSAEDRAGAGLTSGATDIRAKAADEALNAAIKKAQAEPTAVYAQSLVEAWTTVSNKAHSGNIVAQGSDVGRDRGGESWLTRRVVGPVPGWGVLTGIAAIGGGVWYAVKRFL